MNTPSASATPTADNKPDNGRKKGTVLSIEDNATVRQLLRHIFELRPHLTLLEAENGKQGLEIIRDHRPDCILLDIHMPDMNGYMVFEHLRKIPGAAETPVIAMSGDAGPADIAKGREIGFHAFLAKPISIKEFLETIDSLFASPDDGPR